MNEVSLLPALPPPCVTPEWVALLEELAADRGLPPEPWPCPDRDGAS